MRRNKSKSRKGAAALELAVVLSFILFPAAYAMLELSRAMNVRDVLSLTVRSAGSVAIRPGATVSKVQSAAATVLMARGIDPTVATTTVTVNGSSAELSTGKTGDRITITVSVPAKSVNWVIPSIMGSSATISETIVMMKQG